MVESFIYSNYNFDIELTSTEVNIRAVNSTTNSHFSGTVNSNEIYVQPIEKFYKLLTNALDNKKDFSISITEKNGKMRCTLNYKTDFIELDEIFSLNEIQLSQHEITNIKLQAKILHLTSCLDDAQNRIKELEAEISKYKLAETNFILKEQLFESKKNTFEQKVKKYSNNRLYPTAEKDEKFKNFVLDTLNAFAPGNNIDYISKCTCIVSEILDNNEEYIVDCCLLNSHNKYYITNFGKVFLQLNHPSIAWTYKAYCDFKIYDLDLQMLQNIRRMLEPGPNPGCTANVFVNPEIDKYKITKL